MKIICLGDSLTYGYGVWSSRSWVTLLAEKTGIRTLNHGTNGDTSGYMLDRVRRHVIPDKTDPGDILIIMGGANDVLMYGANDNDVSNIIKIADLALLKGAVPVIVVEPGFRSSPAPFYGPLDPERLNGNFDHFADHLITEASSRGIRYFDLRPVMTAPDLFIDGVHPTDEGHALIADIVLGEISDLVG